MSTPVTSLRNIGPAMQEALTRAGIESADQLCDLGADKAYAALLRNGTRPHFIGYYVLVMALQDRPWNDCTGTEKETLRARFDRIKLETRDTGQDALEAALDAIGVRRPASQRSIHFNEQSIAQEGE